MISTGSVLYRRSAATAEKGWKVSLDLHIWRTCHIECIYKTGSNSSITLSNSFPNSTPASPCLSRTYKRLRSLPHLVCQQDLSRAWCWVALPRYAYAGGSTLRPNAPTPTGWPRIKLAVIFILAWTVRHGLLQGKSEMLTMHIERSVRCVRIISSPACSYLCLSDVEHPPGPWTMIHGHFLSNGGFPSLDAFPINVLACSFSNPSIYNSGSSFPISCPYHV